MRKRECRAGKKPVFCEKTGFWHRPDPSHAQTCEQVAMKFGKRIASELVAGVASEGTSRQMVFSEANKSTKARAQARFLLSGYVAYFFAADLL